MIFSSFGILILIIRLHRPLRLALIDVWRWNRVKFAQFRQLIEEKRTRSAKSAHIAADSALLAMTPPLRHSVSNVPDLAGGAELSMKVFPAGSSAVPPAVSSSISLSVIVPARNEAEHLPGLLNSLLRSMIDIKKNFTSDESDFLYEVIVVDDESSDATAEIARFFTSSHPELKVRLVSGVTRPPSWTGKNWACHQGYLAAKGDLLLFTDADTEHSSVGLWHAMSRLQNERVDLLCALPYHLTDRWWEKLLGPFQILILVATAAYSAPTLTRMFAIGQFLLFTRRAYEAQGCHEAISQSLAEDLELAQRCMLQGGTYLIETTRPTYQVRMYSQFQKFVQGWRRNFRLGLKHASILGSIEVFFVIATLTANLRFFAAPSFEIFLMLLGLLVLLLIQPRLGRFSWLGVVLLPFSVAVFVLVTCLALADLLLGRRFAWRGRLYDNSSAALESGS